ncbi:hypothetical protein LCGC14_0684060 [marine sediment metagenome]|uniref:FUZ/MON1/HPS1 first Longin domain-containing protein n=1 Tax=marine sediment metagenome TaxID=412755 RepID=A0A0F9QSF2_9ZZZZ|nr:MAG: hypothetical protein Lokiarch_49340 [Candidatus Lokiarchaeum sp. GC14_75]
MSNFNIEKIRAEKVRDFYLIHRDGITLSHRAYIRSKMDESLLSGFLTAIFAISKELSIKEIQVMEMDDIKVIYDSVPPFLLILTVNKDISLEFGKSILSDAMKLFEGIYDGFSEEVKADLNDLIEELKILDFNSQVDKIVNRGLMDEYFRNPLSIVDEMEKYLVSLFGSMGKEIIESSMTKISKFRANFQKENVEQLVSLIEESLSRKINPSQASIITQQLRNTFSQQNNINKS